MPYSQFTVYSSEDVGAPTLHGMTGSLLTVLNACLVTGYGSKLPAGWLKPFPDTASRPGPNCVGGFTMPSGSGFSFFLNDAGFHSSALGTEAQITGWERLLNPSGSITGSYPTNVSASVGGGTGQFPGPAQAKTGRLIWRKSIGPTFHPRPWMVFADAYTVYFFAQTGDIANTWYGGMFGDIYSVQGRDDIFRCKIVGRFAESSSAAFRVDLIDGMNNGNWGGSWVGVGSYLAAAPCDFMARPWGLFNGGSSVGSSKQGDNGKQSGYNNANQIAMDGMLPYPNPLDSSIYVAPIWTIDTINPAGTQIGPWWRGRWRGFYQVCHSATNFGDGQIFQGSGVHAGKTFRIMKQGPNGGFWAMEISPTVETN